MSDFKIAEGQLISREVRTVSIIEMYESRDGKVVKKIARPGGEGEIVSQVRMLERLPSEIAIHYPALIAANLDTPPWFYITRYCGFPSLRELVFDGDIDARPLFESVLSVLDFLFLEQYPLAIERATASYFEANYISRMTSRLFAARNMALGIAEILDAEVVRIKGQSLRSPASLLREISGSPAMMAILAPPRLYAVHGQMEFDHVLVDTSDHSRQRFILLDPRGIDKLADAAYDLGKLWQSCRSWVDLVEVDRFELEFDVNDGALNIDRFTLAIGDRQPVCDAIAEAITERVHTFASEMEDTHLVLRSQFAEAVHLCSALPFYFEGPRRAHRLVACYLLGVVAFNHFATQIGI